MFWWSILCRSIKSNAIVIVKDKQMLSSGVGQTSRVDALKFAIDKMKNLGYEINNIDITVILQTPTLQPYNQKIRNNLCSLCNINLDQISLKATTSDKLGFLGRKEGAAAFATTLLIKNGSKN